LTKYYFRRVVETVEDLLKSIGREDIPSTEVSFLHKGFEIDIDFGVHTLSRTDEESLESELSKLGFKLVRKE